MAHEGRENDCWSINLRGTGDLHLRAQIPGYALPIVSATSLPSPMVLL